MNPIFKSALEIIGKYWLQAFLGMLSTGFVMLWKKMSTFRKEQKVEDEAIKQAVKMMLLDRIYQSCSHWLEKKYITDDSLKILMKMHKVYTDLGDGDVAIGLILEDVKKLPKQVHPDE